MGEVRRRCTERGAERNMMGVAAYSAMFEMWRGRLAEAAELAEEAVERAEQLGGRHADVIPRIVRAAAAAYAGRHTQARADAEAVLEAARECGAPRMTEWPLMTLGFVEVSLGAYDAAAATLEPLLARFSEIPGTEIMTAWYLPDAVESLLALGRFEEAEPLIEALERDGRRLGRTWMLAAGARCRAMWWAARNDLNAAGAAADAVRGSPHPAAGGPAAASPAPREGRGSDSARSGHGV
jgi:tetratricopeptide (TPR) repeat protein